MPFLVVLVDWGITILILAIIASSVLTWFNPNPRNPVVHLLGCIVDPLLRPIRAILPSFGGLDFSPLVAFLLLRLLQNLLRSAILRGLS